MKNQCRRMSGMRDYTIQYNYDAMANSELNDSKLRTLSSFRAARLRTRQERCGRYVAGSLADSAISRCLGQRLSSAIGYGIVAHGKPDFGLP